MRIIKERGLKKHVGEYVFIGDTWEDIYLYLFHDKDNARRGKLNIDEHGFYIHVSEKWNDMLTGDIKRIAEGFCVGIPPLHSGIFKVAFNKPFEPNVKEFQKYKKDRKPFNC